MAGHCLDMQPRTAASGCPTTSLRCYSTRRTSACASSLRRTMQNLSSFPILPCSSRMRRLLRMRQRAPKHLRTLLRTPPRRNQAKDAATTAAHVAAASKSLVKLEPHKTRADTALDFAGSVHRRQDGARDGPGNGPEGEGRRGGRGTGAVGSTSPRPRRRPSSMRPRRHMLLPRRPRLKWLIPLSRPTRRSLRSSRSRSSSAARRNGSMCGAALGQTSKSRLRSAILTSPSARMCSRQGTHQRRESTRDRGYN